jgi:hypothetical protein
VQADRASPLMSAKARRFGLSLLILFELPNSFLDE